MMLSSPQTRPGVGSNCLEITQDGLILSATSSAFKIGTNLYDHICKEYHAEIPFLLCAADRTDGLVRFDYKVIYNGVKMKRSAKIYSTKEQTYLCYTRDYKDDTIIDYHNLPSETMNHFVISPIGVVLACQYPEKAATDPIGLNMFDFLMPEWIDSVGRVMHHCISKQIPLPVEYEFELCGQIRHKKGIVMPHGSNLLFSVIRIATTTVLKKEAV